MQTLAMSRVQKQWFVHVNQQYETAAVISRKFYWLKVCYFVVQTVYTQGDSDVILSYTYAS